MCHAEKKFWLEAWDCIFLFLPYIQYSNVGRDRPDSDTKYRIGASLVINALMWCDDLWWSDVFSKCSFNLSSVVALKVGIIRVISEIELIWYHSFDISWGQAASCFTVCFVIICRLKLVNRRKSQICCWLWEACCNLLCVHRTSH